jgi:S1-C subfamily serine protease
VSREGGLELEFPQKPKATRISTIFIVTIIIASLFVGGLLGYLIGYSSISGEIDNLQDQLSTLQEQISTLQPAENITYQNVTHNVTYVLGENVSLSQLYEQVKESVVVIRGIMVQYDYFGRPYYTQVQGSGFIYNFTGQTVIITNYHVVNNAINITVTFINGNGYAATTLGSDPYADLAVLSTEAPRSEYKPLEIVNLKSR